jgi:nicotinamidase-related amidase
MMRLEPHRSLLLVVDMQEKLLPHMSGPGQVLLGCARLLKGARRLAVPTLASEQAPSRLGPTLSDLKALLPAGAVRSKMAFSCVLEPDLFADLADRGRDQVVIAGIEAHVAVLQTAMDLKARGYAPLVVADAVASRDPESRALALARLSAAGIGVVDVEMVLLEWTGSAAHPAYEDIDALISR